MAARRRGAQPAAAPSGGRRGRRRRQRRRATATATATAPPPWRAGWPPTAGIDLGSIEGTGAGGKIAKADVLAAANGGDGAAPPARGGRRRGKAAARPRRRCSRKAMNESRKMPTATSFRTLPVDTLDAKRKALNAVLKERGMKVSFTHLIAWAIVRAAAGVAR